MNKGNWGKIRAFFDLQTEEGFTIKGFKLVEGINGLFVGFPSQKGSDDEYYDTVWADRDIKEQVNQLAIKTYGQDVMSPPPNMEPDDFPPPESPSEAPLKFEKFVPVPDPYLNNLASLTHRSIIPPSLTKSSLIPCIKQA